MKKVKLFKFRNNRTFRNFLILRVLEEKNKNENRKSTYWQIEPKAFLSQMSLAYNSARTEIGLINYHHLQLTYVVKAPPITGATIDAMHSRAPTVLL